MRVFVFVLMLFVVVFSKAPLFRDQMYIRFNGETIRSVPNMSPVIYDVDRDGVEDIVIGQRFRTSSSNSFGKIRVYYDSNTSEDTLFSWLEADGEEIQVLGGS